MFKKGSKLYSIIFNKCPRCHEGDFMKGKSLVDFKNAFKMHESCSNCGLKYMMEPSFFYGAMYVTYALTVGIAIITFAVSTLFFKLTMLESFIPIVLVLIVTAPLSSRLSRIIWINFFVHYRKDTNQINKND